MLDRNFLARTDQSVLRFFLEQRVIGVEYHKWIAKVMGFDFEIV